MDEVIHLTLSSATKASVDEDVGDNNDNNNQLTFTECLVLRTLHEYII